MKSIILLIVVSFLAWYAFKDAPSDVELRIRASEPIALDPLRPHSK
jgi:hypothetical protein